MAIWLDTYRGAVETWECDVNGHMNVQFYMARFVQAVAFLRQAIGLGPATVRDGGLGLVALDARIRYQQELSPGDTIAVKTSVLEVGDKTIRAVDDLYKTDDGSLSARVESVTACFDMAARRTVAWPAEMRAKAEALVDGEPAEGIDPLTPVAADDSRSGQPFETQRSLIEAWECDQFGHANSRVYIGRISDAAGFVWQACGLGGQEMRDRRLGSAALEHHIRFKKEFKGGDTLVVRSGMRAIGNKSVRFLHRLEHGDTGEAAALIEVIACLLDLEARRAAVIPDDVRARLEALLTDWDGEG